VDRLEGGIGEFSFLTSQLHSFLSELYNSFN
jgi:hypothetical protein